MTYTHSYSRGTSQLLAASHTDTQLLVRDTVFPSIGLLTLKEFTIQQERSNSSLVPQQFSLFLQYVS